MKLLIHPLHIITIIFLLSSAAFAQQTNTFESVQQVFQQQEQALLDNYGKALDALMESLKAKGDLDKYVIVETEKKRFSTNAVMPSGSNVYSTAVLNYQKSRITLLKKYTVALGNLVASEMKANRIEEAKAVKTEKDKYDSELALLEAKMPKELTAEEKKIEEIKKAFCGKWSFGNNSYEVFSIDGAAIYHSPDGNQYKGTWKIEDGFIVVSWVQFGTQKWKLPLNPAKQAKQTSAGIMWSKKVPDKEAK